jgi:DUF4097 and DUF4098 domain-containing protein YvlB
MTHHLELNMNVSLVLPLSFLALAAPLAAQDFRWHGAIASGKTLEIRGINGDIRASRASGSEAEVTATKRAHRGDPDAVEIKVIEDAEGVLICAVYPSRRSSRPNDCRRHGGQNDIDDHDDVEVTFEVKVPAGVELDANTVNGNVIARDLPADAEMATVNGDIEVEAGGVAHGTTVNGSIKARLGRADWKDRVDFTTVNGSVAVTLPANASADLDATTVNGSIDSDFPITIRGRMNPQSLRGRIGDGGRELKLTTVNGGITIRKTS